ncbi:MAG: N-acetylmuramoyl-L-alanine amidase [Proteobacteria bacterium]|nr:N-acetylmuramoyl-L-alanine amidase [Pseudomonadota bacterium]
MANGWAKAGAVMAAFLFLPSLIAWAQPVPVPAPAPRATTQPGGVAAPDTADDPIGALLMQQEIQQQVGQPQAAPVVIGLRLGEEAGRSRFVVELSDPIEVSMFTLTDPARVVIDMPEVLWRAPEARPSGSGAIRSYRYGLFREGNSRLVIDLNTPVRVADPLLLPPEAGFAFRLVIDLFPTTPEAFIADAGWPEENRALSAAQEPAQPMTQAVPGRRIIIVDAGHGGIDPGTHGASGMKEKDIVLAVAKKLAAALEATGRYTVYMTRDTDVFIPLRERVNIARRAAGDLFVSLHADSLDSSEVRGASVYTLSEEASDREAASLAEKENMSDVIAGVDLSGENNPVASILIDLAQRDTMNRSVRFAGEVLASLQPATYVRPSTPHRSAGFAVLKAPDIPAVLIELGYLSNRQDEREMMAEAWRTRVAAALAVAIDHHFEGQPVPPTRQVANP